MNTRFLLIALFSISLIFLATSKANAQRCCALPDSLKLVSVTDTSFCVSWVVKDSMPCDTPASAIIRYKKTTATTWNQATVSYSGELGKFTFCDTTKFCGLYQWEVRNVCKHSDTSAYVNGSNFASGCDSDYVIKAASIKAYPNPARSMLTLSGTFDTPSKLIITITDSYGNKKIEKETAIYNKQLNSIIDVSQLHTGIYFVTISNGKTVSRLTFVKEQ